MKSFKFRLSFLLPIFLVLFFSTSLSADTIWVVNGSGTSATTSPNPYQNNSDISTTLSVAGATKLRVVINGEVENRNGNSYYDYVLITATDGTSNKYKGPISDDFDVDTGLITIQFYSDYSEVESGVTITITDISPQVPPIMGTVPNQNVETGASFTLDISNYVTETNGDPILSYTLGGDALPAGVSFNTSSGVLSGLSNTVGTYNLSVYATDNDGNSLEDNFTLTIAAPVPLTMGDIPDQSISDSSAFSLDISTYVSGGTALSYTLTGDNLPAGLDFNTTTGIISGTTTDSGVYSFSAYATNSLGDSNSDSFTLTASLEFNDFREFSQRTQKNLFGDVKVIGNTVLCQINSSSGLCEESGDNVANDDVDLQRVPNSTSYLDIPNGSTVVYARLYWTGRMINNDTWGSAEIASAKQVEFKKQTSVSYTTINADTIDYNYSGTRPIYSASANVLSIVDTNATYAVNAASFYTITGATADYSSNSDGLGASGGWMLVVIYDDPNETTARNVTIFDGYKIVTSSDDATGSVTGFVTPKLNTVDTKVYVYVAEGDKYLSGTSDRVKMKGKMYNNTDWHTLGTFDSRIDVNSLSSPNLINNNGVDIHKYLNPQTETTPIVDIITNNEVGADFLFTSDGDVYFPSVIIFSIELYLPKLCYDYSIRQDGSFLNVDRNAYPVARLDSTVSNSDLDITVYLTNQEADIVAENIAIKADVNDTAFDHVGNIYTSYRNGSSLVDRGTPSTVAPELDDNCPYNINGDNTIDGNNACTTGSDIRKGLGYLDATDYAYLNYKLSPKNISGLASVDEPLGLSIKYSITVNGSTIVYPDYLLGSINVPLCEPTNAYTPAWGQFNVVESGQTAGSIKNNIYTKVSRLPFGADVVFDSNPATGETDAPTTNVDTTVLVEIIDMDSFGDINASCANPSSSLSAPIVTTINFDSSTYQTTLTTQGTDYFNFAVKNAAYRIWYFDDENSTLIENWTATTDSTDTVVSAISGLYKSAKHTACSSSCSDETSAGCFTCIKTNYAKPICSRDNFSVRPESYDLKIYDINHTAPTEIIKDSTKFNISNQDGFNPTSDQTTNRMQLASGYNYRFDINATGHDGIATVPGYTRQFAGGSDYNATMYWDPQTDVAIKATACNDTSDIDINFYVGNGAMLNEEEFHNNVGEYKLNIIDTTWTAVDWATASHHVADDAFTTTTDCTTSSTTSTISSGRYGCRISTNHGSDGGGRFYQDHDLEFHPYWFNMTNTATYGANPNPIIPSRGLDRNTTFNDNTFLYMADINFNNAQDQNMSFQLIGNIAALGENNNTLNNFVDNCYAEPIDLTLNMSNITGATLYNYIYQNADFRDNVSYEQSGVITNVLTTRVISLQKRDFNKTNVTRVGSVNTELYLNLDRNSSTSLNPEQITYTSYTTDCNIAGNCRMNADLVNDYETNGAMDLNKTSDNTQSITINHIYGRTHASRQRYEGAGPHPANIYYEAYCFGTIGGNTCLKTLLPQGLASVRTDDIRWFINDSHIISNDGNISIVIQENGTNVDANDTVDATDNPVGNPSITTITYDEDQGYPYKTTMENNASRWLIYNQNDPTARRNSFAVEFDKASLNWSGVHDTNTTTKSTGSVKSNRRSNW